LRATACNNDGIWNHESVLGSHSPVWWGDHLGPSVGADPVYDRVILGVRHWSKTGSSTGNCCNLNAEQGAGNGETGAHCPRLADDLGSSRSKSADAGGIKELRPRRPN